MSRIRCMTLIALLAAAGTSSGDERTTKILLIGKDRDHAYATHTYMDDCDLLAKCLRQTRGVEAVSSNGWPQDPAVLHGVKAIVLQTKFGGNVLFAGPHRRKAEEMMQAGVGLTAIHWGTGAELDVGPEYLKTLGAWFNHPAFSEYYVENSTVRQAAPQHPISRGWKDYDLKEEYYIKLKFMPDAVPIMLAKVKGKESEPKDYPIGWAYERPNRSPGSGTAKGRSFGFIGGHFHANFGIKEFRQSVVNGILWTAHVQIPADGAPCAITKKDMELVPDKPAQK